MSTCTYDTGSMYGCEPACSADASHVVTYSGGSGPALRGLFCARHARCMEARYPFSDTRTEAISHKCLT